MKFVGAVPTKHGHHYLGLYPIVYSLINNKHSFLVSGQLAKRLWYIQKASYKWLLAVVLNGEYVAITI